MSDEYVTEEEMRQWNATAKELMAFLISESPSARLALTFCKVTERAIMLLLARVRGEEVAERIRQAAEKDAATFQVDVIGNSQKPGDKPS